MSWFVVFIYLIPIIGTLASMKRRASSLWSWGKSLRNFLPDDRFYKKIRFWETRFIFWRKQHPLSHYVNLEQLNLAAGKFEYVLGHLRDYTLGLYMMARFSFTLTFMIFGDVSSKGVLFNSLFYYGFFSLLSLWTYRRHVTIGIRMTEFMRVNPTVHPEEFFHHYYRRLGPAATPIPTHAARTVNPENISYLTGQKPRRSFWALIRCFYDTAIFARSAYKSLDTVGEEYGREVFDVMASLWGSRILQLFKCRMIVEGSEKFHPLDGKIILVFNHKSHLDFALNFFALSGTHLASGRKIRPRYLAAKDHFVDNKIVYTGLGVGKLIESVDMVFVDRKGKGKHAIFDACQKLISKKVEIAMYPQGTRALAHRGPSGERLDAGYYTTGSAHSLKTNLGHLKKGCAFLAFDTLKALQMAERSEALHLVFIGIDGTATLAPKDGFLVQTEGTVKFTVGDVLTLHPGEMKDVEDLQLEIHRGLIRALKLHEKLRTRFLDEIKKDSEFRNDLLTLNHALTQADKEENFLPFMIIDRALTLKPSQQTIYFRKLARQLLQSQDLSSLRDEVTDLLFQHRGKELKTISEQEKIKRVRPSG